MNKRRKCLTFLLFVITLPVILVAVYLLHFRSLFMQFQTPDEVRGYLTQELSLPDADIDQVLQQMRLLLSNAEFCTTFHLSEGVRRFWCHVRTEYPSIFGEWQFILRFSENDEGIELDVTWAWFGI